MSDTVPLPPELPVELPTAQRDRRIMLGLIVLVLACYWPVCKFDFVNYDDPRYVYANPNISHGISLQSLKYALFNDNVDYWHPLTWLSHLIDVQFYGLNAGGHHVTSLIIHLASTVLLFTLLNRLTARVWLSAWVAAMFGVHPMHVESVAWIAERKDVLSALFFFLTLLAYERYARSRTWKGYLFVTLAFIGALMSKPMVVTTPAVLMLLDVWPLRWIRLNRDFARTVGWSLVEKLPWFALGIAAGIFTIRNTIQNQTFLTTTDIPIRLRLETAIIGYARYLIKLVWPAKMAVFYPYPTHWPPAWVVSSAVLFALITGLTLWQLRRRPFLFVGWAWFVGVLLPICGIMVVGDASIADRYTYIPYIGLFIAIAWLVAEGSQTVRRVGFTVGAAIAIACAVVTYHQVRFWRDSMTLMGHALAVTENNWTAHLNYGAALTDHGNVDDAGEHFRQAVEIRPLGFLPNIDYAMYLLNQNQIAASKLYISRAGGADPTNPRIYVALGRYLAAVRHPIEANQYFEKALAKDPESAEAHFFMADNLFVLGRADQAERHLHQALESNPQYPTAHRVLGLLAESRGKAAEALQDFERAIDISPQDGLAHLDYGVELAKVGRFSDAQKELQHAIDLLRPNEIADKAQAEDALAKVLIHLHRPQDAPPHADRAIQLWHDQIAATPDDPNPMYSLAVALQQRGEKNEAIQQAQRAFALAITSKNSWLIGQLRSQFPGIDLGTRPSSQPTTAPATRP